MAAMEIADIRPRLRSLRRSQAELARHLELDPSSLVKVLSGQRRISPSEGLKIEGFFGERLELGSAGRASAGRRFRADRIPVFGYAAAGGDDLIAFAEDRVLDYLAAPPFWNGSGDLVYIRLLGDSMEPRYFSGEILPVRLNLPPAKGADCLITFQDDSALVKTYMGQREGKVWALQYNERRELSFEGASVRGLHAIWKPGMV
jgi:phage repressor protein C with HTH and peptisase S24 domain